MAAEGLPVQLACRLLSVAESVATSSDHGRRPARDSTCLADRPDPRGAHGVSGHLRCAACPCRVDSGPRFGGRARPGGAVDGPRGGQGIARHPLAQAPARDANGGRSCRANVHPRGAESVVGHRHHRTRTYEGKVYCAVVLDTFSRRVIGWSIDSSQTAALVTNALGMAIANRDPSLGDCAFRPRRAIHLVGLH
jgi:putative transposase